MRVIFCTVLLFMNFMLLNAQDSDQVFLPVKFNFQLNMIPEIGASDAVQFQDIDIMYQFTNLEKNYQTRFSLYTFNSKDNSFIKSMFPKLVNNLLQKVAIKLASIVNVDQMKDSGVKEIYNGDIGYIAMLQDCESNYSKEYKYVAVFIVLNYRFGVICQAVLFNDFTIFKSGDFDKLSRLFRFPNK